MRGHPSLAGAVRQCRPGRRLAPRIQRRAIQISAAPTSDSPITGVDPFSEPRESSSTADARFEVIGAPYSLLSVSLSASQRLYTRRGTLVGVNGKAENAQSTLSLLEPFRRAPLGIPFLYQRISSTSPITALISTKSPITSLVVVNLNGTIDWMVTQRNALLAWTGHTLSITPRANTAMTLSHWGSSQLTGRGLVAFAGPGQIYQITLGEGEEYIAHPGNVVAYTMTPHPPLPYRFKSANALRLQIPDIGLTRRVQGIKFFRVMAETATWRAVTNLAFAVRTAARRTIWGDRLFLRFRGPTTLLLSSRAARISDVMTARDVDEVADSPAGSVQAAVTLAGEPREVGKEEGVRVDVPTGFHFASVGRNGKVKFEDAGSGGGGGDDVKR